MGGAVSTGEDNDELMDNLSKAEYIKTDRVERVFRSVDRGDYYLPDCRENAYKDLAWRHDNLHMSAPCIYAEVMEYLELKPGITFLNLGSGTGYLSTMVGLVIGSRGINHGVEIHDDVIDYATSRLHNFLTSLHSVDQFDFSPPQFVRGNCLELTAGTPQYDRVYCGAACPPEHEGYMKSLINVGGILVMPLNDKLVQIKRVDEKEYVTKSVLPVSFATLITPPSTTTSTHEMDEVDHVSRPIQPPLSTSYYQYETVDLPPRHPLPLQDMCRSVIRSSLRQVIELRESHLTSVCKVRRAKMKGKVTRSRHLPSTNATSRLMMRHPLNPLAIANYDDDDDDGEGDNDGDVERRTRARERAALRRIIVPLSSLFHIEELGLNHDDNRYDDVDSGDEGEVEEKVEEAEDKVEDEEDKVVDDNDRYEDNKVRDEDNGEMPALVDIEEEEGDDKAKEGRKRNQDSGFVEDEVENGEYKATIDKFEVKNMENGEHKVTNGEDKVEHDHDKMRDDEDKMADDDDKMRDDEDEMAGNVDKMADDDDKMRDDDDDVVDEEDELRGVVMANDKVLNYGDSINGNIAHVNDNNALDNDKNGSNSDDDMTRICLTMEDGSQYHNQTSCVTTEITQVTDSLVTAVEASPLPATHRRLRSLSDPSIGSMKRDDEEMEVDDDDEEGNKDIGLSGKMVNELYYEYLVAAICSLGIPYSLKVFLNMERDVPSSSSTPPESSTPAAASSSPPQPGSSSML